MKQWKTLSRRRVFEHKPFLAVEMRSIELPGGEVIDEWSWIETPDYVNVLAETDDGRFLCFRQVKYAIEGTSLAPVGGFIEPGEEPEAAAKRELMEETGYAAGEWVDLGSYAVDANRGAGRAWFFLARQARRVSDPVDDDLEEQAQLLLTRPELEEALHRGEFKVLAWASIVALGLRALG